MSAIRPLERQDLPQVASLFELIMRSGSRTPPPQAAPFLERTLLDYPWVDAEIPSLVYESPDGEIVGFLGSHVRRLRVNGDRIRVGYVGHLMSEPAMRTRGIGALLLRHYMAGPQDASITDSALGSVRPLWERLGATVSSFHSLAWTRFLRPFRFGIDRVLERRGWTRLKPPAHMLSSPLDAMARLAGRDLLRVNEPTVVAEELTSRALLEHFPSVAGDPCVRPDYDEEYLSWLFREMGTPARDFELVKRLVRDQSGRPLGWYIAYLYTGGVCEVQQIVAAARDMGTVLDDLLYVAWQKDATLVRGRLEPFLLEPMMERHCVIRVGARFLIHARSEALIDAILAPGGLLTRMDGEYWTGFHLQSFATGGQRTRSQGTV